MSFRFLRGATFAGAFLAASAASAHVVFERREAPPNSPYRAILRVTHGCKGSATTSLRVTLPDGAVGARPMAKPGWSIGTVRGPYKKAYPSPHGTLSEGVREIAWIGGRLPDDQFDEFVFSVTLSEDFRPGETVYFPVEQTCESGAYHWAQIPKPGQNAHELAEPAPGVSIVAARAGGPSIRVGDLTVEAPWLRATPGGAQVAGGYVRIVNRGTAPDRLVGATMALAQRGEVHEMTNEKGVMKMRPVEGLTIAPGASVDLKPGGYHLMFLGLKEGLKQGQSVKGSLVFEKAGTAEVTFEVGALGARGPDHLH